MNHSLVMKTWQQENWRAKTAQHSAHRTPAKDAGAGGGSLRVFKQFASHETGSDTMALSRPTTSG
jgi:hypothetical protein